MSNVPIVHNFLAAVQDADIQALLPLIAEDFSFADETAPNALDQAGFIGWVNSLAAAIPDFVIDAQSITEDGALVVADVTIDGTIEGDLDLTYFGAGLVPPSHAQLGLAPQTLTFTLDGGVITMCVAAAVPGAGVGAIIEIASGLTAV